MALQYALSGSDLLTDTGIDDNVGIHGHTDTEDDTCDTRKRQGDIKRIQMSPASERYTSEEQYLQPDPEGDIPRIINRITMTRPIAPAIRLV